MKMKNNIVGIVAEFNPMHYGHCYLIQEAKRRTSAEAVVCVMSGNYVQRGAPAIMDKWTRTEIALNNGVDLVVEIPTAHCLGNAAVFAQSAVTLLESIGQVTHIAFGSESGDIDSIRKYAIFCRNHSREIEIQMREFTKQGMNYPVARERSIQKLMQGNSISDFALNNPNDLLALEYLRNASGMESVAIQRKGAGYHDEEYVSVKEDAFQSSTSIRRKIGEGTLDSSMVPWDITKCDFTEGDENWIHAIRYQILSSSPERLDDFPGGGEGLGNRLQKAAREVDTVAGLIERTKSKRYTYTRISRWLYQILLGIDRELQERAPEYIRILGFTEKGREIIRKSKKNELNSLPFIDNINKRQVSSPLLDNDLHSVDVYNLMTDRLLKADSDYCRRVIVK